MDVNQLRVILNVVILQLLGIDKNKEKNFITEMQTYFRFPLKYEY